MSPIRIKRTRDADAGAHPPQHRRRNASLGELLDRLAVSMQRLRPVPSRIRLRAVVPPFSSAARCRWRFLDPQQFVGYAVPGASIIVVRRRSLTRIAFPVERSNVSGGRSTIVTDRSVASLMQFADSVCVHGLERLAGCGRPARGRRRLLSIDPCPHAPPLHRPVPQRLGGGKLSGRSPAEQARRPASAGPHAHDQTNAPPAGATPYASGGGGITRPWLAATLARLRLP